MGLERAAESSKLQWRIARKMTRRVEPPQQTTALASLERSHAHSAQEQLQKRRDREPAEAVIATAQEAQPVNAAAVETERVRAVAAAAVAAEKDELAAVAGGEEKQARIQLHVADVTMEAAAGRL